MRTVFLTFSVLALVTACDRPPSSADTAPPAKGQETGPVPTALVGKWAADPAWCANTTGPERPIEITSTRFEGYENSCAVITVIETAGVYQAELSCQAEGQNVSENTRWQLSGQVMSQSWPDEPSTGRVQFTRCPVVTANPN